MIDVVIVGGGAAGLWAAVTAARSGLKVLVLEKTARFGTKILASGGTRCNLTTALDADSAALQFGHKGARFLRTAFRITPPESVRDRFESWGVSTVIEPEFEKVFPRSGRAVDVRDALVDQARKAGADLRANTAVRSIAPSENGWTVRTDTDRVDARALMLCAGGKSYPKSGTTGDGYLWLESLGLPIVRPVPALTPLVSSEGWVRELAGISLPNAAVRLSDAKGRLIAERRRPLLFTHRGVSGPGPMDVSEPVARAEADGESIAFEMGIDLVPDRSWDVVRAAIDTLDGRITARRVAEALELELPRRVLSALSARLNLSDGPTRPSKAIKNRLASTFKHWGIPIHGTRGFDFAEVTAGGLALGAVDPGSMAVKGFAGLYVFGELLDVQGPIGGFNFQVAFACAELAARAAGR